jgi:hypothetical protein
MVANKKIIIVVIAFLLVIIVASCTKNTTVYTDNSPEVTTEVFFAQDIIPILNSKCSISGCHNTGGHIPDLTATNAYNSLNQGNYFDKSDPANSSVYLWLTGKKSTAMPVGGPSNPSNLNQMMLAWIKQGAKNN